MTDLERNLIDVMKAFLMFPRAEMGKNFAVLLVLDAMYKSGSPESPLGLCDAIVDSRNEEAIAFLEKWKEKS